jgi:hypothetical protein
MEKLSGLPPGDGGTTVESMVKVETVATLPGDLSLIPIAEALKSATSRTGGKPNVIARGPEPCSPGISRARSRIGPGYLATVSESERLSRDELLVEVAEEVDTIVEADAAAKIATGTPCSERGPRAGIAADAEREIAERDGVSVAPYQFKVECKSG